MSETSEPAWWRFVNSQFGLWLLSTVLVSGVSYYWNQRKDAQIEHENQLAGTAQLLEQVKQPDPQLTAALNQLPSRVYLHIADERQRELARSWQQQLAKQQYLLPGIENVGKGPNTTEVRYFFESDRQVAGQIVRELHASDPQAAAKWIRNQTKARSGTIEIWMSAKPGTGARRSR